MMLHLFHPFIRQWFNDRFEEPTEPQRLGWPHIIADRNTLIAAPTGSGKTLSAFLVYLDRLLRQWLDGRLENEIQVVYVSPLKALSNDIQRNLQTPLAEIRQIVEESGLEPPPIRVAVRTGDTPASERQAMLRRPPHILVTTPESLYLLLTAERGRERLRTVKAVIVDEIHALARDKRGSHLTLTLERLSALCDQRPVRIGLSATQRPMDQIARFLVGTADGSAESEEPECEIVDAGHLRELDLEIEVPPSELSAVCSMEQWAEIYERITELVKSHRSTLIFVNTRRLAERVAFWLAELLGEEAVASHHGSLSRQIRLSAEQRLKDGELKAIVATASLEMGIDIGYIDLVCQIGSPRSISTLVQRVGRSGHSLGKVPKGRLFPLTRDELLEGMALIRAVKNGELDAIEIPEAPLDILAQQIVAETANGEWSEEDMLRLCRRAWPYRNLSAKDFDTIIELLSEGMARGTRRGAYLHRDRINGRIRSRRSARLAAITSGGAIPETADYRVVTEDDNTYVGTLDEDFAIESMAGDIFLLGNTSWRIRYVRGGEVVVNDAQGAPPNIPFWIGEAPGRTVELSDQISRLRADLAEGIRGGDGEKERGGKEKGRQGEGETERRDGASADLARTVARLQQECGASAFAAEQAARYVQAQIEAIGVVPTKNVIVFERFFDEAGGMQLVIHSPLGARINRAWGLALRKCFCRSFDFELQAAADDNGIVLSMGPQHSMPIESLFKMIRTDNAKALLEQAALAVPMFQVRWRWNVTRALAVLRFQNGKKVPFYLQRLRADDLLASAFPDQVGCLENHHGDVPIPDHAIVRQTMYDCLHEAMDLDRWLELLADIEAGRIELIGRDTREPSPFSYELLNANPYAFLDDAPLEERRSRAVVTRRSLPLDALRDLAKLDPEAIAQVRREAWPMVRDADELHDALMSFVLLCNDEGDEWKVWFDQLVQDGRAATVSIDSKVYWIAAERWPLVRTVYTTAEAHPSVTLPAELDNTGSRSDGWIELARGRIQHSGPISDAGLAEILGLPVDHVSSALEALEGEGVVLRGQFSPSQSDEEKEWCDRRLLARIHRLTVDGLRKQIQPVEPNDFLRFLVAHHQLQEEPPLEPTVIASNVAECRPEQAQRRSGIRAFSGNTLPEQRYACSGLQEITTSVRDGYHEDWGGPVGVRQAIAQLQGFEMSAGAWEKLVLPVRVGNYDPAWLDQLFFSGEVMWGRLQPPQRDENRGPSMAMLTRTVPITLMLREDLPWLLDPARSDLATSVRSNAKQVLEALTTRGALFFQELLSTTGLLAGHLEEALRELAALGLVTSDSFAAVRSLIAKRKSGRRRVRSGIQNTSTPVGRWSLFPGPGSSLATEASPASGDRTGRWCQQLLKRYGVVFRDLLVRETAAPAWHELVRCFRRMELRGEARGGRFVSGVAGEQYATQTAVERLRKMRDQPPSGKWQVISATDPLNLSGVITEDPRVTATNKNALILRDGCYVAAKQVGQVEFFAAQDSHAEYQFSRALQRGRAVVALARS